MDAAVDIAPPVFAISVKGRSIPSNMLFKMPGASVTETGEPEAVTVSPGFNPLVSSYTWTMVRPEVRPMTSPTKLSLPT